MVREGKVIVPARGDVWPHELDTARTLAATRGDIEFIPRITTQGMKTPDIVMGGVQWEMKSPRTNSVKSLQKVLRRATRQSPNVIIDSSRMKGISDAEVEKELRRIVPFIKALKRLVLVTKGRDVLDLL